ncbi:hypothetical protein M0811_07179 [Anaeramoeba ignava]|uniref:Uncharacterized protein n=1 Tax=Anaeramoeba ignava TaxID=1746090 RepID=A0A9Q0RCZ3_ANAIG|nr:hypothetical protein M0811_07179 [Anaeramoeba ignava]
MSRFRHLINRDAAKFFKDSELNELHRDFRRFDLDGDGSITVDEFKKVLTDAGENLTAKQISELIKTVDTDESESVEFPEFVEMMYYLQSGKTDPNSPFAKFAQKVKTYGQSGSTHTYSNEEKEGFEGEDLFSEIADGIVLAKLLKKFFPDKIDLKRLTTKRNINKFEVLNNINLVIQSSKKIGCKIVNIGPEDIYEKKVHLSLGLVWQVVRASLMKQVQMNLQANQLQALLFGDAELVIIGYDKDGNPIYGPKSQKNGEANLANLPPEKILMSWMNYHLKKIGCDRIVKNFTSDLQDSVCLLHILHSIDPNNCDLSPLQEPDLYRRAELTLQQAAKLGARKFISAKDIEKGNPRLMPAFLAQLFVSNPAIELDETRKKREQELELQMKKFQDQLNKLDTEQEDLYKTLEELEGKLEKERTENEKLENQLRTMESRILGQADDIDLQKRLESIMGKYIDPISTDLYGRDGMSGRNQGRDGLDKDGFGRDGMRGGRDGMSGRNQGRDGLDKDGFGRDGNDKYGRDGMSGRNQGRDGLDKDGFGRDGNDKYGRDGMSGRNQGRDGLDKDGFGRDGMRGGKDGMSGRNQGRDGLDKDGFGRDGNDKYGKDGMSGRNQGRDGLDKDGFGRDGNDKYGRDGMSGRNQGRDGLDKDGFGRDGNDKYGRDGMSGRNQDRDGLDKDGFGRDGMRGGKDGMSGRNQGRDGLDKDGFGRDGNDKYGKDGMSGRNQGRDGLDKDGFGRDGNDKYGKDGMSGRNQGRDGLDKDGFGRDGNDKYGRDGMSGRNQGRDGLDKDGFGRDGNDKYGRDGMSGRNQGRDGLDKDGFGKDGMRGGRDGYGNQSGNLMMAELERPDFGNERGQNRNYENDLNFAKETTRPDRQRMGQNQNREMMRMQPTAELTGMSKIGVEKIGTSRNKMPTDSTERMILITKGIQEMVSDRLTTLQSSIEKVNMEKEGIQDKSNLEIESLSRSNQTLAQQLQKAERDRLNAEKARKMTNEKLLTAKKDLNSELTAIEKEIATLKQHARSTQQHLATEHESLLTELSELEGRKERLTYTKGEYERDLQDSVLEINKVEEEFEKEKIQLSGVRDHLLEKNAILENEIEQVKQTDFANTTALTSTLEDLRGELEKSKTDQEALIEVLAKMQEEFSAEQQQAEQETANFEKEKEILIQTTSELEQNLQGKKQQVEEILTQIMIDRTSLEERYHELEAQIAQTDQEKIMIANESQAEIELLQQHIEGLKEKLRLLESDIDQLLGGTGSLQERLKREVEARNIALSRAKLDRDRVLMGAEREREMMLSYVGTSLSKKDRNGWIELREEGESMLSKNKWSKKWMLYKNGQIFIYSDQGSVSPEYMIAMDEARVIRLDSKSTKKPNCLEIRTSKGNIVFSIKDTNDFTEWYKVLRASRKILELEQQARDQKAQQFHSQFNN